MPTEQPPSCPNRGDLLTLLPSSPFRFSPTSFRRNFRGGPESLVAADCRSPSYRRGGFYTARSGRPFAFQRRGFHVVASISIPGTESADRILRPFPFCLSSLVLPRPFHPLASRAVLPSPFSRPVDGDIYDELYDSAFFYADDSWHRFDRAREKGEGRGWRTRVLAFSSVIYTPWKNISDRSG